ncbi:MAG: FAD-dependent oxidoreductase, partial [Gammaproteobacteria bacterium]|nr:FAD-dependent oxidoreductase [Gammaproteobacteria bacterium]
PGVIAITRPMPRLIDHIIIAPGVHLHQRNDGRIVLGEQQGAPQNQAHALRLEGRPNAFPDPTIADQHAARMLAAAEHFLPAIKGAQIDDVHIGWRPLPIDGHPVLGASTLRPNIYLAIMHSGVSLAPIVGQLVTHELLNGAVVNRLQEFRPGRKFSLIKRY